MVEIGFYHLTRTPQPEALARLLDRTLRTGQRALVLCPDDTSMKALDTALWSVKQPAWLPHGTAADGDPDLQPIWLSTTPEAPNDARFLFLVDGADHAHAEEFTRVFDLFDGNDDSAVAAARLRWRAAKDAGHSLAYWKQGAKNWEKAG